MSGIRFTRRSVCTAGVMHAAKISASTYSGLPRASFHTSRASLAMKGRGGIDGLSVVGP